MECLGQGAGGRFLTKGIGGRVEDGRSQMADRRTPLPGPLPIGWGEGKYFFGRFPRVGPRGQGARSDPGLMSETPLGFLERGMFMAVGERLRLRLGFDFGPLSLALSPLVPRVERGKYIW